MAGALTYTWSYSISWKEVPTSGATPYTASASFTLTTSSTANADGTYSILAESGTVDGSGIVSLDTSYTGQMTTLNPSNVYVDPTTGATRYSLDGIQDIGFVLADGRQATVQYETFYSKLYSGADYTKNAKYYNLGPTTVSAFSTTAPCYVRGTSIATPEGEVAVEALRIGGLVTTAGGRARRIRWIGRRRYGGRFLAASEAVHPVRFRRGSLGGGLPWRDLLVSPRHAMLVERWLVPAACLVNGRTIVVERGLREVEYFHVELESHDVLLAEGAPAESYLDDGSRGLFHDAGACSGLPGAGEARFCAPMLTEGAALEAIRDRLSGGAGLLAA